MNKSNQIKSNQIMFVEFIYNNSSKYQHEMRLADYFILVSQFQNSFYYSNQAFS